MTLLGPVITAFIKGLFDSLFGWLQRQQEDRTHEELGATQAQAAGAAETIAIATEQKNAEDAARGLSDDDLRRILRGQ